MLTAKNNVVTRIFLSSPGSGIGEWTTNRLRGRKQGAVETRRRQPSTQLSSFSIIDIALNIASSCIPTSVWCTMHDDDETEAGSSIFLASPYLSTWHDNGRRRKQLRAGFSLAGKKLLPQVRCRRDESKVFGRTGERLYFASWRFSSKLIWRQVSDNYRLLLPNESDYFWNFCFRRIPRKHCYDFHLFNTYTQKKTRLLNASRYLTGKEADRHQCHEFKKYHHQYMKHILQYSCVSAANSQRCWKCLWIGRIKAHVHK